MVGNKNIKRQIPPPPADDASDEEWDAYLTEYGLEELEAAGYARKATPEEEQDFRKLSAAVRSKLSAERKSQRKPRRDS